MSQSTCGAFRNLAFGYSLNHLLGNESFLDGVRASSPQRRISVLMCCGLLAEFGWWALYRYAKPLVSVLQLALILLVLRSIICCSSLKAGAQGGLWSFLWPSYPLGALAIIGAAAEKMLFTANVLIFELTQIHIVFLIPILFSVVGAVSVFNWCKAKKYPR